MISVPSQDQQCISAVLSALFGHIVGAGAGSALSFSERVGLSPTSSFTPARSLDQSARYPSPGA